MIIPINNPAHSKKPESRFPPQLAKLGTDEIILIELQGSFQVEGDSSGQLAARLNLDNVSNMGILNTLFDIVDTMLHSPGNQTDFTHWPQPPRRQNREPF